MRRECLDRLLIFGESPPPHLNGRSLRHFHAQPARAGSPYVCRLQQTRPRMILEYLGISGNSVSSFIQTRLPVAHRPAATLSNVKGKRDAPSLPANVTCLHSTQTNRSEPTMCVSGMPGAQSCKCSCEVTFSQPKHSFVTMVATCVYRELRPY